jgi:hypothetical protein
MRTAVLVLTAATVTAGCGAARPGVGFGAYDRYQPVLEATHQDITLASQANVMVLIIQTPTERQRPVLFSVQYPLYDTDQLQFAAGRHRLAPRLRTAAAPPRCGPGAAPTLSGCRPYLPDYPGVQLPSLSGYYATSARLLIASDEAHDPFPLAEFLIARARTDTALKEALLDDDPARAQAELERALRDRFGATGWAAYYRSQS